MDAAEDLIREAEKLARLLKDRGVEAIVIGATALAAHQYVRFTQDVDLAVNLDLSHLRELASNLETAGYEVALREPDAEDPLGGVLDVRSPFGLVQIISFADRFPAVIRDAIQSSSLVVRTGSPLRIVPLPHLVALKLYAGGFKSKADIVELLSRNPDADLEEIAMLCSRYRLRGFDEIRRELG